MNQTNQDSGHPSFSVTELFARYLERQTAAQAEGLGYPEPTDEARPYDATPVQPIDPQLAWKDALAVLGLLNGGPTRGLKVPPDWPVLVNQQEPAVGVAFALGNYPQLVRNVYPLLTSKPAALRQGPNTTPLNVPALLGWASRDLDAGNRVLAAAVLRLARHFDRAEELLSSSPGSEWELLSANERAALAWHRGQTNDALALWDALPDNPVVLFNRGMARLFLGQYDAAQEALTAAVAGLPETSAWHHLASLYLTMAESSAT
jgi:hypothetical protein